MFFCVGGLVLLFGFFLVAYTEFAASGALKKFITT